METTHRSNDRWMDQEIVAYIYTVEYYVAVEKGNWTVQPIQMGLEGIY